MRFLRSNGKKFKRFDFRLDRKESGAEGVENLRDFKRKPLEEKRARSVFVPPMSMLKNMILFYHF